MADRYLIKFDIEFSFFQLKLLIILFHFFQILIIRCFFEFDFSEFHLSNLYPINKNILAYQEIVSYSNSMFYID